MDTVRDSLNKGINSPPIMAAVGLVVGIILGLVWAYVISPVQYIDGNIEQLRDDLKVDYLRMAIDGNDLDRESYDHLVIVLNEQGKTVEAEQIENKIKELFPGE